MKSLKITNLPEEIEESSLLPQLSQLGNIKKIKLCTFQNGNQTGEANITMYSLLSYDEITRKTLTVQGKILKIEALNNYENPEIFERKICLFGIPKQYKSRKLKKIFQKTFGGVENAYIRKNRSREFNYGFVTFYDKKIARKALVKGTIEVKDTQLQKTISLEIRKFEVKEKRKKEEDLSNEECREINSSPGGSLLENITPGNQELGLAQNFNKWEMDDSINSENFQSMQRKIEKSPRLEGSNVVSSKKVIEDQELAFFSSFRYLPPLKLKYYLDQILIHNPNIKKFSNRDIQELELFYHNQARLNKLKVRTLTGKKITSRISRNHQPSNIRLQFRRDVNTFINRENLTFFSKSNFLNKVSFSNRK